MTEIHVHSDRLPWNLWRLLALQCHAVLHCCRLRAEADSKQFFSWEKQWRDTCPVVIQTLIACWPWQWFIIHRKQYFHLWASDCLRLISHIDQISHMPGSGNLSLISRASSPTQPARQHVFVLDHQGFTPLGIPDMLTCHMTFPCIALLTKSSFSWGNIKSLIPATKAEQSFLKSRRLRTNIISNDLFDSLLEALILDSPFKVTQICSLGWLVCVLIKRTH